MNLPNKLTVFRIILIPVFLIFYYANDIAYNYILACMVFIIASVTDIIDGHLARKYNQITNFGKLIDPIADKLLIGSVLIVLCASGYVNAILTIILIGREFVVSGFRVVAAAEGKILAADGLGKLKTVVQSVAIGFLLVGITDLANMFFAVVFIIGTVLIWLSGVLSLWSCVNYIVKNKDVLVK